MKENPKKSPRKSAPRKRNSRKIPAKAAPVDPIAVLESIAGNKRLKPTPRVQAARELVKIRMATLVAQKPASPSSPEARAAEKTDRLAEELNKRALAMMNPKGSA